MNHRLWIIVDPEYELNALTNLFVNWGIIDYNLGIFHNKDENVFVWINEEDHSRLISMEKGDDVKGIVSRFARLTEALQGYHI